MEGAGNFLVRGADSILSSLYDYGLATPLSSPTTTRDSKLEETSEKINKWEQVNRIAIIGGGVSGLVAAWDLQYNFDVTLYEKSDRLGGHANTIKVFVDKNGKPTGRVEVMDAKPQKELEVESGNESGVEVEEPEEKYVVIEAGAEFFNDPMYTHFMGLLELLDAPIHKFPFTYSFYKKDGKELVILPPIQNKKVIWKGLTLHAIYDLVEFKIFIDHEDKKNTNVTLQQYADSIDGLTKDFKEHFLYPFFSAAWGTSIQYIKDFAASTFLDYIKKNAPKNLQTPVWNEVQGGMSSYIQKLEKELSLTIIKRSTNIESITLEDDCYKITEDNGKVNYYTHLILATDAPTASRLLKDIPEKTDIRTLLNQIEYYKARIAIHGDPSYMPPDKSGWSVANIQHNEDKPSTMTMWKEWINPYTFKSWINEGDPMPEPLYYFVEYQHLLSNLNYIFAQKAIEKVQGNHKCYFAGMWASPGGSHDAAIVAAMKVAEMIDPDSENLQALKQTSAKFTKKISHIKTEA